MNVQPAGAGHGRVLAHGSGHALAVVPVRWADSIAGLVSDGHAVGVSPELQIETQSRLRREQLQKLLGQALLLLGEMLHT